MCLLPIRTRSNPESPVPIPSLKQDKTKETSHAFIRSDGNLDLLNDCGRSSTAAAQEPAKVKIRVLLTYGGHGFEEKPFFAMFDSFPGIVYTKAPMPKAADLLKPGLEKDYDVIVMYDMTPGFTPEQQKAFVELLNDGIGLVSLHHNLGSHQQWDEFRKIIGGIHIPKVFTVDGKKYGPSGATDDQDISVTVADKAPSDYRGRPRLQNSRRNVPRILYVAGGESPANHRSSEKRAAACLGTSVWQEPRVLLHARARSLGLEQPELHAHSRQRHPLDGGKMSSIRVPATFQEVNGFNTKLGCIPLLRIHPFFLIISILSCFSASAAFGLEETAPSEKSQIDAILGSKESKGIAAEFAVAVRRVNERGGQFAFDEAGNLVDVDLASDRVSVADADLPCLLALPHLKRLKLSGGGISDVGVRQIGSIAGLEELSLQDAQIDDEGLKPLENLKNLSSLTIRRSPRVTDSAIEHLLQLPKLSKLGLLEVGITNRGLERLKGMTRLRALDLRGCSQVGNAGLEQLASLKNLKILRLGGYLIDDDSLVIVKKLSSLTSLTIDEAAVKDAGLAHLADLPLEEISFSRCFGITDEGLKQLSAIKTLRRNFAARCSSYGFRARASERLEQALSASA